MLKINTSSLPLKSTTTFSVKIKNCNEKMLLFKEVGQKKRKSEKKKWFSVQNVQLPLRLYRLFTN